MNKKLINKFDKAVIIFNLLDDNYQISVFHDYDVYRILIYMPNDKILPIEAFYDKLPNWTVKRIIKWFRELIKDNE